MSRFRFEDVTALPARIKWMPRGRFVHPLYGEVDVNEERLQRYASRFREGVYDKDWPISVAHDDGRGQVGSVPKDGADPEVTDDGIWVNVRWTPLADELVATGIFPYFSPEWEDEWLSPAGEKINDMPLGGGVVIRPWWGESHLQRLVAAEPRMIRDLSARAHDAWLAAEANWHVNGAITGLPLAQDRTREWDADAVEARVRSWASGPEGEVDWGRYGRAFLVRDENMPEQFGAHKFPLADVEGDDLVVVFRAVAAAKGRLPGADLPGAVKKEMEGALERLAARFDRKRSSEPPRPKEGSMTAEEVEALKTQLEEANTKLEAAEARRAEAENKARLFEEERRREAFEDRLSSLRFGKEGDRELPSAAVRKASEIVRDPQDLEDAIVDLLKVAGDLVATGEKGSDRKPEGSVEHQAWQSYQGLKGDFMRQGLKELDAIRKATEALPDEFRRYFEGGAR